MIKHFTNSPYSNMILFKAYSTYLRESTLSRYIINTVGQNNLYNLFESLYI